MWPEIAQTCAELGIMAGLVLYFVWRTSQREDRLAARIEAVEEYNRTRLEALAIESNAVARDSTTAINNNNAILARLENRVERLEQRAA